MSANISLVLLCLVPLCLGSLTSLNPKTNVGYEIPASGLELPSFQSGRDQRTTHWDSRSHSNLDDDSANDDRDRGRGRKRGRLSYPSLREDSYSLRFPTRFERSEKSPRANFDITKSSTSENYDSRSIDCITDELPREPIDSWLSLIEARRNALEDARNLPSSLEGGGRADSIPRCRRTIDGWLRQEPVYVEEPRWIVIEIDGKNMHGRSVNRVDPFYVARGKRSPSGSTQTSLSQGKPKNLETRAKIDTTTLTDYHRSSELARSLRKKRDAFGSTLRRYLLEEGVSSRRGGPPTASFIERSNGYVVPRDKHSDILDILNEPFFISRGKKDSVEYLRSEINNGRAKALVNYETTQHILDSWLSSDTTDNCDSNSRDCSPIGIRSNEDNSRSSTYDRSQSVRDRRGLMKELLKEMDPFYVARGKKTSDISAIREINETSGLLAPTVLINDKLSDSVDDH